MTKRINPNHVKVPENFCRLPNGYGVVRIAVSGTADTSNRYGMVAFEMAKEIGREIASQGAIIVTGATTGFPMYAAMGAKDVCGFSIGVSPASTEQEHVKQYGLPTDYMDVIIYTGFGYAGRDLLFIRAADAVIIGPGRIGTINEFAVAFEDRRPIGILEGEWLTDSILKQIIDDAHRPNEKIIYDSDPKRLVEKLIAMTLKDRAEMPLVYNNYDSRTPINDKKEEVIL
jgi:uncharacterized protein (TIGR00725 family)